MENIEHTIERVLPLFAEAFNSKNTRREHELIQLLRQNDIPPFRDLALSKPLELFTAHFLVRHCLYLLRREWCEKKYAFLDIQALELTKKELETKKESTSEITGLSEDLLESYYLDLDNLDEITEREVELLLNGFWEKIQNPTLQSEAYETLGLSPDAGYREIKLAFKRCAKKSHPDKGGDPTLFKKQLDARDHLLAINTKS